MDALTITEASMLHDVDRLRMHSHNLANATTPGFRRDIGVAHAFQSRLSAEIDRSQGALRYSANSLDVALEGDGFFVLQSSAGPVLTRQGAFHLDAGGRLVGAGGAAVVGTAGEIVLTQAEPRIDHDGNVWEGDKLAGTLRVVRQPADAPLVSLGSGLYAADAAQLQEVEQPRLRQGYTEASNVVPMREMVRLIETMRHFEAGQRLLRSHDDMMDRALSLLGEP
jgi:flagellar basal body rod protein FlgG